MNHPKKYFLEQGIDDQFIEKILENIDPGDIFKSFEVYSVDKGFTENSVFEVVINTRKKDKKRIIAKNISKSKDVSGGRYRDPKSEANEKTFLEFGTENNLFVPKCYMIRDVDPSDPDKKPFIFIEKYDQTLEDVILNTRKEIEFTKKDMVMNEEDETKIHHYEDTKKENIFNYFIRAIDVYLMNSFLASEKRFHNMMPFNGSTLEFNAESIYDDMVNKLFGLRLLSSQIARKDARFLEEKVDQEDMINIIKKTSEWYLNLDKNSLNFLLNEKIAKEISSNPYEHNIINMDISPYHILVNRKNGTDIEYDFQEYQDIINSKNEFEREDMIREKYPYHGFAITDHDKIGYASEAVGLAVMLNHPLVIDLLGETRIKGLMEHGLAQRERLRGNEQVNISNSNMAQTRYKFENEFNMASRYALIRYMGAVSWDYIKDREKYEQNKEKGMYGYPIKEYINICINRFTRLPDENHAFTGFDNFIKELRL